MKTIYYDFHIHTCLSPCANDDMTPANIVGMAVVAGLDSIAITDHNSCKNCRAAMRVGEQYGITVIPGMELCTLEEVHVVCLFETIETAEAFGEYVSEHMVKIKNQPKFFGNQIQMSEDDEEVGREEVLLLSSATISFAELPTLMEAYHGIMIPAHLDKQSNSLVYQLGFIPEDAKFRCFELHHMENLHEYRRRYSYLENCKVICDSDAHQLEFIHGPTHSILVNENTIHEILKALS